MQAFQMFETIPCPLCGTTAFTVVYPGTFPAELSPAFLTTVYRSSSDHTLFEQVVRCRQCDLVYLNPRLKPEIIVQAYAEGEDATFVAQDEMRIRTFTAALHTLQRKHGLRLSQETKVLDVGCAGGAFLRAANTLGLAVTGIEPSQWLGEYARSKYGLDVKTGTLADYQFPDNSFDLVTLWDVIEHVPSPASDLAEICRILKPNGLLVINYPDFGSLIAKLLGRKWPFLLSVHLAYYTRRTIRKQLANSGFRMVAVRLHWQTLELGYIFKRATAYFSFLNFVGQAAEKLGLGSLPMKYWMGQTQVVAQCYGKEE